MMNPEIFPLVSGLSSLKDGKTTRFWPFHSAPAKPKLPYATWQTLSGEPDKYVTCVPDADVWQFQVDCWDDTADGARSAAKDIRTKLEADWPCDLMEELGRDPETNLYRYVMRFSGRQHRS